MKGRLNERRSYLQVPDDVTVLARESDIRQYKGDLESLKYDINEGPCLGQSEQSAWMPVPNERVKTECEDLGNDGTFFDEE